MRPCSRALKRKSSSSRVASPIGSPPRLRSPLAESSSERLRSPSIREEDSPKRIRRTSSRLSNHSLTSPISPSPHGTPKRRRKSTVRDDFEEMVDEESPVKKTKQKRRESKKKAEGNEEEEAPARRTRIDDPNAPKKPLNAFLRFVSARRLSISKEHHNQKILNTVLGDEWKVMSEEEKKPYLDMVAKDKAIYDKKVAEYHQSELYAEFQESKKIRMKERKSLPVEERKSPKNAKKGERHDVEDAELASLRKEQAAMKEEIKKFRRETEILSNRMKAGKRTKEILHEVKPINVEIQHLEKKNKALKKRLDSDKERIDHIDKTTEEWLEMLKRALLEAKIDNSDDDVSSVENATGFLEGLSAASLTSLRHAMKNVCKEHVSE